MIKLTMTSAMVELTEERRRNWRMLEYLGGLHIERLQTGHRLELENWQQKYRQSTVAREASIDSIARGMAELASISGAPADKIIPVTISNIDADTETQSAPKTIPAQSAGGDLVEITEEDMTNCSNCKTCYQDLGELFEKTTIMVDGNAKEVGRVIPGIFDKIDITQELVQRAARVADDCDVEIIHFNSPVNTPA